MVELLRAALYFQVQTNITPQMGPQHKTECYQTLSHLHRCCRPALANAGCVLENRYPCRPHMPLGILPVPCNLINTTRKCGLYCISKRLFWWFWIGQGTEYSFVKLECNSLDIECVNRWPEIQCVKGFSLLSWFLFLGFPPTVLTRAVWLDPSNAIISWMIRQGAILRY